MKDTNDDIERYLSSTKFTTRDELVKQTGLSDRAVRKNVAELKTRRVVIYSSQTKGYRLAREYKNMSKIQREEEKRQIEHSLNDCRARTTALNKQKRKYIAYLKKAEQIDMEEQNYNHIPRID